MMTNFLERFAFHAPHLGLSFFATQILTMASLALSSRLLTLARFRSGRILLHVVAMMGDRSFRFHAAGIVRELPWIA